MQQITPEQARAELERRRQGGITPEQARAELERRQGEARAQEFVRPLDQPFYENPVGAVLDSGPMAALEAFNLSDEVKALSAHGENFWRSTPLSPDGPRLDPDLVAQAERDRLAAAREGNMGGQGFRELTGGAIIPFSQVGRGVQGVMAGGAVLGGIAGAGQGEDIHERAQNAAIGTGLGAVSAYAGDKLIRGAGAMFGALSRGVRNQIAGRNMTRAQRRAVAQLRRAFRDDGISAEAADEALRRYAELGFDDASLLDVGGDNVRRLVRGAAQEAGPASQSVENLLESRIETRADRVADRIGRYISRNKNFRESMRGAVRERAERATPLYNASIGTPDAPVMVPREEFADLLDRVPARVLARVRRVERLSGGRLGDLDGAELSLRDMQAVKFGLDDLLEVGPRSSTPLSRREAEALRALRNEFIERMPQGYREANDVFAGDSALINAMEMGRAALREDTEVLADAVAELSASERDMFRIGIVRAVRDRAGNVRDRNNMVDALIGNQNQRDRIRQAFDSDEAFNEFIAALRAETSRVQNARFVASSSGSQTAPRLLDSEGIVEDILQGRFGAVAGRVTRPVARAIGGAGRQEANEQLVNMATSPVGRDTVEAMVESARAQYGDEVAEQIRRTLEAAAPLAAIPATNAAVSN